MEFKKTLLGMRNWAAIIVLTRDYGSGSVTLDDRGEPALSYPLHSHDSESMMAGMELSLRIHAAAGAEQLATGQSDFGGVRNIPSAAPERAHAVTEACNDVRAAGVAMDGRVPVFSAHQMGTARMGAEPSVSVVDLNGESWEVKNLYVADASLFPTSSGSNPMMTTLSLSHVVAQRLKRTLALKQIAVPAVAKL